MTLHQLMRMVAEVNHANGWLEMDRTFGEDIALLHSEVSEALEAWRDGEIVTTLRESDGKPEGMPSELADVLVRLLDTCKRFGVNLEHEVLQKLQYNKTRGYRHGGKVL